MLPHKIDPTEPSLQIKRDKPYRFIIGFLIMFLFFGLALNFFAVSPILKLILDEFPVGFSVASLLTSLVILCQVLVSVPSALLAGKYNSKNLNTIGWVLIAAPSLSIFLGNFWMILISRILIGAGFGIIGVAHVPILITWFKQREYIIMNSGSIIVTTLGIAVSTAAGAPLADLLGWRGALTLFGLVSFAGAIAWVLFGRGATLPEEPTTPAVALGDFINIVRSKTALVLANMDAVAYAQYAALTAWLPLYYFDVHDIPLLKTGFILGLMPLCATAGITIVAAISFRTNQRKPFLYLSGIMIGVGGLLAVTAVGSPWMYLGLFMVGAGSWFYVPLEMTIAMELPQVTPNQATLTMGFLYLYSGVAGFIGPILVGALTDLTGTYLPGLLILSGFSWFFLIGTYFMPETGKGNLPISPKP